MTRGEVMTLTVDQGWVTEASIEDVKLLPGVRRTVFRLYGGEWALQWKERSGYTRRNNQIRRWILTILWQPAVLSSICHTRGFTPQTA